MRRLQPRVPRRQRYGSKPTCSARFRKRPCRTRFNTPEPTSPLLAGLNPQQQKAVRTIEAPLIIVAGPGTGKTRTLTHRIAYLIREKGILPSQILAITFTNKAAEEMATRLAVLLGPVVAGQLVIKTFHAFGVMLLRESGAYLGLSPNFTICNDSDRVALLKQLYLDLSEAEINQALEQISAAKNQLISPLDPEGFEKPVGSIYQAYESALRQNQLLDFDDLAAQPVRLFENYPEVLKSYRERFCWISVDEYQDINLAQYRLLRLLAGPETNLCVIGDPDQAIYGFRGARREYFLQFRQDFPAAKLLPLSQNYRSTQLILDASSQVIARSEGERVPTWSEFLDKTRLDIYQAPTDKAEAEYIVHQIEQMVGGTSYFSLDSGRVTAAPVVQRSFADFAVLYRLNVQSLLLIEAFERSGIPFQTIGQTPFYERPEVKEMLACLWFIYNPETVFHLNQSWAAKKIKQLVPFLREFGPRLDSLGVAGLIEEIQQFCLEQGLRDPAEKWTERIQQLRRRAIPFENRLRDFLESTVLQRETDVYDPRADRVTLMTLHASKGLEFPVVFIVGCEEGLLPYQRPGKTFDADEERRLFYVGMTRAQHKLVLTHTKTRFLFGQRQHNDSSRFLSDIEQTLKEIKQMAQRKAAKEKPESPQLKLF
ncbi:MAG: UvrD-helicase domain-containing protein [Anaerolineae bacterium]